MRKMNLRIISKLEDHDAEKEENDGDAEEENVEG